MTSEAQMPLKTFEVGDSASISRTISERDVEGFAELTGDKNPVHLDESYARSTRFGARIAHGMLTAGLISSVIGTEIPGPGAIYVSQSLYFMAPVFLGDTLTATATITKYDRERGRMVLSTGVRNQHGQQVLDGEATIRYRP